MISIIPFKPLPSFIEEITLGEVPFILYFNWNSRGLFWTLDILDREENDIIIGIKLVNQYELLGMFAESNLPKGKLYVVDNRQQMGNIEYASFTNGQCSLVFEDA